MPVINMEGQPLPDGHPFKGNRIIFGVWQPEAYLQRLGDAKQGAEGESPATPKPEPSDIIESIMQTHPELTQDELVKMSEAFGF